VNTLANSAITDLINILIIILTAGFFPARLHEAILRNERAFPPGARTETRQHFPSRSRCSCTAV